MFWIALAIVVVGVVAMITPDNCYRMYLEYKVEEMNKRNADYEALIEIMTRGGKGGI